MFSQDLRDNDYIIEFDSDQEGGESSDDEIGVILHGTPEQKRRLRRRSLGQDSSSEDDFEKEMEEELDAAVKNLEAERKQPTLKQDGENAMDTGQPSTSKGAEPSKTTANSFYDDMYFDSDEEGEEGKNKKEKVGKHPVLTNDELLYDPKMDDEDQQWVDTQRRMYRDQGEKSQHKPPGGASKKQKPTPAPSSDAVLNCPACLTTLCIDCQRHELYMQQYRAMFVMNCQVDNTEQLAFPQTTKGKQKKKKGKHKSESSNSQQGNVTDNELYHPVKCTECTTEVGVYDKDEVYHFFNVIASHG